MSPGTASKTGLSAREAALKILYDLEKKNLFAEESVAKYCSQSKLSIQERRLVAELVFGTTKMRKRIDYQLEFADRIPAYAAVDESVNLAYKYGHKGVAGLVNGVLRNFQRKKEQIEFPSQTLEFFSSYYSFPEWLVEKWLSRFNQENVIGLCEYFNRKPALIPGQPSENFCQRNSGLLARKISGIQERKIL